MKKNKEGKLVLYAGNLSLNYDKGDLRYIKTGNSEILRRIYPALRDSEWLNIDSVITEESIIANTHSFSISYIKRYTREDIDFRAKIQIIGTSENVIEYSFEGEALTTFLKNRIGLCLHHPVKECAGNPCIIRHSDGSFENTEFPLLISPHQPFMDVRSLKWNTPDCECFVELSGDIFETEDQRNWTDASFKTYGTPLAHPRPVLINKGEKISQTVRLEIKPANTGGVENSGSVIIDCKRTELKSLPQLGIGRSSREEPLTPGEISILRNLSFSHYRTELYLFASGWEKKAEQAIKESAELGYKLELALFFDEEYAESCNHIINVFKGSETQVRVIALYHRRYASTPADLAITVIPMLRTSFPGAEIAVGTNGNFAQLNRNRPGFYNHELLCYSVHPQEHSFDNDTLTENLAAQEDTVRTAVSFAGKAGIWVSPVNINRRFNANIKFIEDTANSSEKAASIDSRMMGAFGMCWTAGSMKYLFESEVIGVTFYETVGERGIMQGDFPSAFPDKFPSERNMIFPVFSLFRFILDNKNLRYAGCISSAPLKCDAIVLTDNNIFRAAIINFSNEIISVKLPFAKETGILKPEKYQKYEQKSENRPALEYGGIIYKNGSLQLNSFSLIFIEGSFA